MTIQPFLSSATPQAIEYIEKNTYQKNKADYEKLKKLFDSNHFEARSFADTELNIISFDWKSLDRDRNWWWQLQALPFLNWFTNSFQLQNKEEQLAYFSICLDALQCWINNAKNNKESPLVWHDHAAAYRVRNITNWLLFCHTVALPIIDDVRSITLASLVIEHLDWLKQDNNYSRYTNHGFDQAMISLTVGLMFFYEGFKEHCQLNRQRLKDELSFAFTSEGVHKENSPGYQKMMLGRLKQLRTLAPLGENEISELGEQYIKNAENFLKAITLPNGFLPMIGDTRGGDEGIKYNQNEKIDIIDYSHSGYVVIRGADNSDKEFFLLLKNTHESDYHRHDDDMMIYLFYNGEVVLGDGGLYKHHEKDELRKYLRTHLAHSVPFIDGIALRKKSELSEPPTITISEKTSFQMTSVMFGKKIKRNIDLKFTPSLIINISDHNIDNSGEIVSANFFFEKEHSFSLKTNNVTVISAAFKLDLNFSEHALLALRRGWNDTTVGACVSHSYGDIEPTFSFSISHSPIEMILS
ncbi:heparinase II/III domain-containing protein [Aeromonas salmonicida]